MWTLKLLSPIRNTPGLSQKTIVFCGGITIYSQVTQSSSVLARRGNSCLSGARLTKAFIGGGSIAWPRPRITSCIGRDCGVIPSTRGSGKSTFVSAGGPSTSGGTAYSIVGKGSERYIVAARKLVAGEVVFDRVGGRVSEYSTRHSVQVGERQHLDMDSDMALTNHSCVPNCRIEIVDGSSDHVPCVSLIVRAAEIQDGELITLDYNAMEIDMSDPFDCLCGAPKCRGRISGFSNLAPDIQAEYIAGGQTSGVGERSAGAVPDLPPLTPVVKAWLDASRNKR